MKTLPNNALLISTLLILKTLFVNANAEVATPGIDQRQENQAERIEKGVESGRITQGEENKLEAQQNRIEKAEDRAKADGVVTRAERARLSRRENVANRNIYRKKRTLRHY